MARKVTYSENPNHRARAAHARGDKAFRTYDVSAIKPKRSPLPAIIGIVVLIAAIALVIWFVSSWLRGCSQVELLDEGVEVQVTVVEGEGPKSVAKTLFDAGLIESPNVFTDRMAALGEGAQLQPGVFTLAGGMSVDEIIAALRVPIAAETFTVPEGSTLRQIADIVEQATAGRIAADEFVSAASDASVYARDFDFLGEAGTASLEGFLFPKSYPIDDSSTADSIIRMMLDQFRTETAGLDYSYAESQGLSHYDVVKLASMIERETDESYRATVSSVFYNRMAWGMTLDSDATLAYVLGREPTGEELEGDDPYNTYTHQGLPPTPICSPGIECLQAACAPESTSYLYFYIAPNDEGVVEHYFAEDYDQHQANIAEATGQYWEPEGEDWSEGEDWGEGEY